MKYLAKLTIAACATLLMAVASVTLSLADDNAPAHDVARYVAGMSVPEGSPLEPLTQEGNWKVHARHFDQAWANLSKRQLEPIARFQQKYLPVNNDFMLYLFSGPDFLYANAFYPNADTYVLTGLEPVGSVPSVTNLSVGSRAHALQALRASMQTIVNISFFITKKMASQLRTGKLTGTLPVIYVFMARAGKKVVRTELVTLNTDGTIGEHTNQRERGAAPGAKITFADEDGRVKTLYYFRTDLSNNGMQISGLGAFVESLGPSDSLVKSASYLLHGGNFKTARDLLLKVSERILQDDTGSPLRYFDKDQWSFKPFGYYLGPIPIFAGNYQRDLKRLFVTAERIPINFGFGYKWRQNQSNVLLVTKNSVEETDSEARKEAQAESLAAIKTCRADCSSVYEPCRTTVEQRMEECVENGRAATCMRTWAKENNQCVAERLACTRKCG